MKRASAIIIAVAMWCGAIAYVVAASRYARERRAAIAIKRIDIRVADAARIKLATADSVREWLAESGQGLLGRPVDAVDTRAVERLISARNGVKSVRAHTDLNGNLRVKVVQREPLMRVDPSTPSTGSGTGSGTGPSAEGFWVTRDGWILPFDVNHRLVSLSNHDTLLVKGAVPVPFDPSRGTEYAAVQRQSFADYLAEYRTLRADGQRLTAERAKARQELRAAQSSGPKRFWGRARKDAFERAKARRVENARREVAKIDRALEAGRKKTLETRENEKKSTESLAFLPKLANFVEFVEDSDFWSTKIARIDVLRNGDAQELIIVPRGGEQIIELGALDGTELEKMNKLEAFWRTGEMARYARVDVKYKDQIVCRVN